MSNQSPKQRLRSILIDDEGVDLFGKNLDDGLAEACKDFLLEQNYKVLPPLQDDYKMTKLGDLRNLFYALSSRKYASSYAPLGRGGSMDNVIMRNFVNSRMKEGVTRKNALIECANIMETLFKYSDEIGLKGQITINMFDPGLFSWVVEKALKVIDGQFQTKNNLYVDDLCEKACDNLDVEWAMFDD